MFLIIARKAEDVIIYKKKSFKQARRLCAELKSKGYSVTLEEKRQ